MIGRTRHLLRLKALLRQFPVVAILGPRQVGKTTLAHQLVRTTAHGATLFDLENDADLGRLADPLLALRPLRGLVVIDEIQRRPDLFRTLRVLADEPSVRRRFLVLGSASPELLRQGSETLAGRIALHELSGFSVDEIRQGDIPRLWRRGGFPRSFLSRSEDQSVRWRRELIRTYLERDLPALGLRLPAPTLRRFWMMVAHYHGQIWNASEPARSFGVAHTTIGRYLDVLTETFMVRQLPSWHENIGKRQVKAPKVYVRDTGVLHALLGLAVQADLEAHPKVGASWEGFALETAVARLQGGPEECYFWATHSGAELDLLIVRGRRRLGFEFKRSSSPAMTRSMKTALEDLHLERLWVVHAGSSSYDLAPKVRAIAFPDLLDELKPLL